MRRRQILALLLLLLWTSLFVVALYFDRAVAQAVHDGPLFRRTAWFVAYLKLPGSYLLTLCLALLVLLLHPRTWRAALPLVLSGPLVGLSYMILKWIVGRHRPVLGIAPFEFHPFAHGLPGLFHAEAGLSFPSGHAAMAFATATCLAIALPRWSAVFFLIAAVVGTERVLENAHYLSDVVAGAGLGVLCGWIAVRAAGAIVDNDTAERRLAPNR